MSLDDERTQTPTSFDPLSTSLPLASGLPATGSTSPDDLTFHGDDSASDDSSDTLGNDRLDYDLDNAADIIQDLYYLIQELPEINQSIRQIFEEFTSHTAPLELRRWAIVQWSKLHNLHSCKDADTPLRSVFDETDVPRNPNAPLRSVFDEPESSPLQSIRISKRKQQPQEQQFKLSLQEEETNWELPTYTTSPRVRKLLYEKVLATVTISETPIIHKDSKAIEVRKEATTVQKMIQKQVIKLQKKVIPLHSLFEDMSWNVNLLWMHWKRIRDDQKSQEELDEFHSLFTECLTQFKDVGSWLVEEKNGEKYLPPCPSDDN